MSITYIEQGRCDGGYCGQRYRMIWELTLDDFFSDIEIKEGEYTIGRSTWIYDDHALSVKKVIEFFEKFDGKVILNEVIHNSDKVWEKMQEAGEDFSMKCTGPEGELYEMSILSPENNTIEKIKSHVESKAIFYNFLDLKLFFTEIHVVPDIQEELPSYISAFLKAFGKRKMNDNVEFRKILVADVNISHIFTRFGNLKDIYHEVLPDLINIYNKINKRKTENANS